MTIRYGDKEFGESKFYYADPAIFEVFNFPILKGNSAKPFNGNNSIIVTKSIANKLFGTENPVGKIIRNDGKDLTVSAVAKDIPGNTQMQWDYLAPSGLYEETNPDYLQWGRFGDCYTYLLTEKGISSKLLDEKLNALLAKNTGEMSKFIKLYTMKLIDIYLHSDINAEISPTGNITYVYLLSAVAILILLIASFNFINLSTVRSIQRSKEVGLKKVLGAGRSELVRQFISESFFVTAISLLISIILYQLLNPVFSDFLGFKLAVPSYLNYNFYASIVVIIAVVGLASGIYPAFFLSRHNPLDAIRGISKSDSGKLPVRKALVVLQFAISIFLISCTVAVFNQLKYVQNADLGIDKSDIVLLDFPASAKGGTDKYLILKNKLLQSPDIKGVSGVYTLPGINSEEQQSISLNGTSKADYRMIRAIGVDYDFAKTMGVKILAGRNFAREFATDKDRSILLNESAVKMLGLKNPVGSSVFIPGGDNNSVREVNVVGVVKDFNIESLHKKIVPYFLYINPLRYFNIAVKINKEKSTETLAYIKSAWAEIMPDRQFKSSFFEDQYAKLYADDEKLGGMFSIFSIFAIFIACLGLLGLSSFATAVRTKEIGIRKALGASVKEIMILMNKDYLKWVITAFVIACPAAWYAINKWLDEFAYRITLPWWLFPLAGGIVFAVALLTVTLQVLRAVKINPIESLRYE